MTIINRFFTALRNSKRKGLNAKFKYFMRAIDIFATMEDKTKSISDKVKIAILFENGNNHPDPSILDGSEKLADFISDNNGFIAITTYFNRIVKTLSPGSDPLNSLEISKLTTVKDCIDKVTEACK